MKKLEILKKLVSHSICFGFYRDSYLPHIINRGILDIKEVKCVMKMGSAQQIKIPKQIMPSRTSIDKHIELNHIYKLSRFIAMKLRCKRMSRAIDLITIVCPAYLELAHIDDYESSQSQMQLYVKRYSECSKVFHLALIVRCTM